MDSRDIYIANMVSRLMFLEITDKLRLDYVQAGDLLVRLTCLPQLFNDCSKDVVLHAHTICCNCLTVYPTESGTAVPFQGVCFACVGEHEHYNDYYFRRSWALRTSFQKFQPAVQRLILKELIHLADKHRVVA